MKYVTGIYALNLPSPDGTPGDWHFSALNWENITVKESQNSVFNDWGIYNGKVPQHFEMPVATHIRACLDLIEEGNFSAAQGMNKDFIIDEKYNDTIFSKVSKLKGSPNWEKIDAFMGKEYLGDWLDYKEIRGL